MLAKSANAPKPAPPHNSAPPPKALSAPQKALSEPLSLTLYACQIHPMHPSMRPHTTEPPPSQSPLGPERPSPSPYPAPVCLPNPPNAPKPAPSHNSPPPPSALSAPRGTLRASYPVPVCLPNPPPCPVPSQPRHVFTETLTLALSARATSPKFSHRRITRYSHLSPYPLSATSLAPQLCPSPSLPDYATLSRCAKRYGLPLRALSQAQVGKCMHSNLTSPPLPFCLSYTHYRY